MAEIFWHNLEVEEVLKILRTDIKRGLNRKEVEIRQREFGKNRLPKEKPLSKIRIFFEQFKSPLIYILIISGIITLFLEDYTDSIVIFLAVFLNTIVGFIQENKSSETLRKLKKVVKHQAKVWRNGSLKVIDSAGLVPGDIIILTPGDKVPADGRIISCHNLKINEIALTGEWLSARKKSEILPRKINLADRDNMVYMGTVVEDGKGRVVVTETGVNTEIGKIAVAVKETPEEKTPYQKKLAGFSRTIGIFIVFISFLIFLLGILAKKGFVEMFTTSIAVAVAAIPEGLPVAMTVILALGMKRILDKKGLVRKLASAETLGSASVIATDKTATLTEGKMKVLEVIGNKFLSLKAAALTSESFVENPDDPKEKWVLRGRPTDKALLEAAIENGINYSKEFEKNKIEEFIFNPKDKFAAAVYKEGDKRIFYICGAPEVILERSNLKDKEKLKLEKKLEKLTKKRLRVVASAYRDVTGFFKEREITPQSKIKEISQDLNFAGYITLYDPIRKEVKDAIKICRQAGIKPIIVSGDHRLTVRAVAEELGFKIKDENILEGEELDELSDKELDKRLDKIKIYSRVEPRHKMRIISAWQTKGEVVAMTGDGINDAPALKKADIGVALGSGTEVAKETSDLILLNDSFSIIVAAIEEGRAIIDNIRKVITYLLSDSFAEVILVGFSILAGFPLPVTAVQILWVNLIEDGLPNIALSFEPKEKDLMKRKPATHRSSLLNKEMKVLIFAIGVITDFLLLGLFIWLLKYSSYQIYHIRSIIFAGLAIDSLFYVFSCKSLRKNIWKINLFSNKVLLLACFLGISMLLAALYLPPLHSLLKTEPLNIFDWQLILSLGVANLLLIELTKWYFISKGKRKQ